MATAKRERSKKVDWVTFREDLFTWGVFGVIVSVLPIVLTLIQRRTDGKSADIGATIANGDLVLVSAVLAAGSLGALIGRERSAGKIPKSERLVYFAATAILFGGGWEASSLSGNAETRAVQTEWAAADPNHTVDYSDAGDVVFSAWLSGGAFAAMLVVGCLSIYMMSLEDR